MSTSLYYPNAPQPIDLTPVSCIALGLGFQLREDSQGLFIHQLPEDKDPLLLMKQLNYFNELS